MKVLWDVGWFSVARGHVAHGRTFVTPTPPSADATPGHRDTHRDFHRAPHAHSSGSAPTPAPNDGNSGLAHGLGWPCERTGWPGPLCGAPIQRWLCVVEQSGSQPGKEQPSTGFSSTGRRGRLWQLSEWGNLGPVSVLGCPQLIRETCEAKKGWDGADERREESLPHCSAVREDAF